MKVHALEGCMIFACPGCGREHVVRVEPLVGSKHDVWEFNGDVDKPTFSPSYHYRAHRWEPEVTPANVHAWQKAPWDQIKVEKICHSLIVDGRIEFLDDCTHFLRGQTVDLPDWKYP